MRREFPRHHRPSTFQPAGDTQCRMAAAATGSVLCPPSSVLCSLFSVLLYFPSLNIFLIASPAFLAAALSFSADRSPEPSAPPPPRRCCRPALFHQDCRQLVGGDTTLGDACWAKYNPGLGAQSFDVDGAADFVPRNRISFLAYSTTSIRTPQTDRFKRWAWCSPRLPRRSGSGCRREAPALSIGHSRTERQQPQS